MRPPKPLRILALFEDTDARRSDAEYEELMRTRGDWLTEGHVIGALRELGHDVHLGPIFERPQEVVEHVERVKPDLVWNFVEAFRGERYFESHVVGLLELLGVPYTGCGHRCLMLCQDKALSKKVLRYHRVPVPPFVVSHVGQPLRKIGRALLPVLVKPLAEEGSVGIARDSFAETEEQALKRVRFLHERLGSDVIVERYVEGREIYAAILGDTRPRVLPLRELTFSKVPDGEPRFASFKAKWDPGYRERWGIRNVFAEGLPEKTEREITRLSRRIFRILHMRGYGRVDLRVTPEGEVSVVEANPNPDIGREEDFAQAAAKAGTPYLELVQRLTTQGLRSFSAAARRRA